MAFNIPSLFTKKEPPIKKPKRIPIINNDFIDQYLALSVKKRSELCSETVRQHHFSYPMWNKIKTWYSIKELGGLDFELTYEAIILDVNINVLTEKEFCFRYDNGEIIVIKDCMPWSKFFRDVLIAIPEIFVRIPDLAADMVDDALIFYPTEIALKTERTKFKYFYRDVLRNKILGFSNSLRLMSAPYSYREEMLEQYAKKRIVESYDAFRFPLVELGRMVKDGYQVIYPETHMEALVELYLTYVELTFMQDLVIFFKNKNDDYIGIRNSESDYTSYYIPLENKVNEEIHKRMSIYKTVPFQFGRRKG